MRKNTPGGEGRWCLGGRATCFQPEVVVLGTGWEVGSSRKMNTSSAAAEVVRVEISQ